MEKVNGKSPASFRWIFLCATMGLAVSAQLCFAAEDQNASRATAIMVATVISALSAIVAVIAAVIASRSADAVIKSAFAAMTNVQKKYRGMLPPAITTTTFKGKRNTLYNFLGIPPDADNETLKKAFREAVKATHPDIHSDDPDASSRFRRIVAANAFLRDAKQRAIYDRLLQRRFRLKPESQQRQSKLRRLQLRLKTMLIIVPPAIVVVVLTVALLHGYRLFAPFATTAVGAVKQDDNDTSTTVAAVRADTIRGDMHKAGEPVERAGAQLTELLTHRDETGHKHYSGGVPNGVSESSVGTSAVSSGNAQVIAGRERGNTASLSAPPPPMAVPVSDHSEAAALLARGRASLSNGDVALARVFLRRAAERDDPQAALALGGTYDPTELRRLGIPNFQAQADPAKAREWYRRAADLGSADAFSRLDELSLRRILVDESAPLKGVAEPR
jgi:ribosomal protein S21